MLSLSIRFFFAVACLAGLCYSALLARADLLLREASLDGVSAAARLIPYNPRYLIELAGLQPEQSLGLLHQALALNGYDAPLCVQLGLKAEFQNQDTTLAERYYRRAADVNHMFFGRSNLLNFYFRYQRRDEFFRLVPLTLQMTHSDPRYFFALIWSLSNDARFNESLLPNRLQVLLPYADFLLQTNRFGELEAAFDRVFKKMVSDDINPGAYPVALFGHNSLAPSFLSFFGYALDRLLATNHFETTQRLWNDLHNRRWLDVPASTPSAPLTNGEFRRPSFGYGFDWTFLPVAGVAIDQLPESSRLNLAFNGKEPEACWLVQQYIVLMPNRRYRLKWDAESEAIPKHSGLHWRLVPITDEGPITKPEIASPDLLGIDKASSVWDFTAPDRPLNLLMLEYVRSLGTTRPEGDLSLGSVSLTLLP